MVELNERIIEGFVGSVLAKRFNQPAPIPQCHREWWELCTGPDRFVAIAAPRGHAKSTAITHSYTLACLLFRQRTYALIISDTETQAVLFLGDIKKELTENEDLIELFGIRKNDKGQVEFIKETESDVIVACEDGHQFRIMAKGSEQKVRGLKWGSKRPDLIICDDLENDEIVMNQDRREKFRRWFNGALVPVLAEGGVIRIVGTILHLDSLLERLMPKEWDKKTQVEDLKIWTTRKQLWKAVKYMAHTREWDKFLWPEYMTPAALKEKYQDAVANGHTDVYYQEYLNTPIDPSTALFRKSDFLPMRQGDENLVLNYYIAGDLAISEKTRADFTCFVVGGMDQNGLLYIRNVIRERMDSKTIVDTILALERRYKPSVFALEDGAITKSIGPFLYEEMPRVNEYANLVLITPAKDKIQRAQSINARMRANAVKFDKTADWYEILEAEMCRFPRDRYDDQVDAMAHLGHVLDKMVEAPSNEEIDEYNYQQEIANSGVRDAGRSAITGY